MDTQLPGKTRDYLAQRLDGARDLYLLALALGERGPSAGTVAPMIGEARVHFVAVLEESRMAGLDTGAIAETLKASKNLTDNIRPEVWARLEDLIAQRGRKR